MRVYKFKYNSDNKVEFIKCEESVPDSIHITYTDTSKSEYNVIGQLSMTEMNEVTNEILYSSDKFMKLMDSIGVDTTKLKSK